MWGAERVYAVVSQADSYLGLAGHAQEEAEGPSQRGACPGPRVPFQLATAAKRRRVEERGKI